MKLSTIAILIVILVPAVLLVTYLTLPTGNTDATRFDTLIVLGTPALPDGSPSPEETTRTAEAVREFRAGVAPHIIFTGGAAHNQYVEADVMARLAESQGVPSSAIVEEPQALNTIQNIYYSAEIMHQRGWHSAEVVSSPSHIGRAGLILRTFDRRQPVLRIQWHTHPAPWPPHYFDRKAIVYPSEALRDLQIRLFGFPSSRFLPGQ